MNRQERAGRTLHLRSVRKVLATLERLSREQPDYRPSVRELMELTGMSSRGMQSALKTLRDDYGYITQGDAVSCAAPRTIRLIPQSY